jgi:hypothetical protein
MRAIIALLKQAARLKTYAAAQARLNHRRRARLKLVILNLGNFTQINRNLQLSIDLTAAERRGFTQTSSSRNGFAVIAGGAASSPRLEG